MSLADELQLEDFGQGAHLSDLDSLSSGGEEEEAPLAGPSSIKVDEDEELLASVKGEEEALLPVPQGGVQPAEELEAEDVKNLDLGKVEQVEGVAKLMNSKAMKEVLSKIEKYRTQTPNTSDLSSSESPEYRLIVQANNLAVEIENEILLVHKFTRDHYNVRFPELESLVLDPFLYCKAVLLLGNPSESEPFRSDVLKSVLPGPIIMVISMTSAATKGSYLTPTQWITVEKSCEMLMKLVDAKGAILSYVESRMQFLAPNLSEIVGTRTATKLLGVAGGLLGLSRMPACNVYLLGAQKKSLAGLSSLTSLTGARKHTGFVYQSELVQDTPEEYRMKAQRTIGAKCVLAARIDIGGSSRDGTYGRKLREELIVKLTKLSQPPPQKIIKALPVPTEGTKKRRGGKKARKAREGYAASELHKLKNRMKFGEVEEEVGAFDETVGMGMIGSGTSTNRLRAQIGEKRTQAKMSKMNKNRLAALKGPLHKPKDGTVSGLASSLVFTPVQGLELVDSQLQKKRVEEANAKWFADGAFSVIPGKRGESSGKETRI